MFLAWYISRKVLVFSSKSFCVIQRSRLPGGSQSSATSARISVLRTCKSTSNLCCKMDQPLELDMDMSTPELVSKVVGVSGSGGEEQTSNQKTLQMAEEFNIQRAKMKELFLQKEEEVRRVTREKQQLEGELTGARHQLQQLETLSQNQRSEIQSLQLLVQETVEVSSSETSEVRQLQTRCLELEQQLNLLTRQREAQEVSLAPSVLVQAVTKSIARRLGADPDKPDNLDDSMKKAQEDAELLRSLVVPLEDEIKVLKEKLRDTDTQLQQLQNKKSTKTPDGGEGRCDMCANYEAQLVAEQAKCADETTKARNAQLALKMATDELEQTGSLHAETISIWKAERSSVEEQLTGLRSRVESAEQALAATREAVAAADRRTLLKLTDLTVQRETLQERLDTLERENEVLSGKYSRKAREMQLEEISLPEDAEELQLYSLRLREELIAACVGREAAVAAEETLRSEFLMQGGLMREQIQRCQDMAKEIQRLQEGLQRAEAELQETRAISEQLRATDKRLQDALTLNSKQADQIHELRSRVSSLQNDLDNSEKVQQDFVRLSQSLQVQLERIREADTEVRWQHDDDVGECTSCRQRLPPNKKKNHCRHCGRIFCAACLTHAVPSGPRKTPSHVCSVCHTLLEPNTRPYFSTEAPHTPD